MTSRRRRWKSAILERRELTPDYLLLTLSAPAGLSFAPGMFIELLLPGEGFSLPRPFSVLNAVEGRLELLIKVVGRETTRLRDCAEDCTLQLAGPLGTPFPERTGNLLLVGGGVGLAPLLFLQRQAPERTTLLAGFRNATELKAVTAALPGLQSVLPATDDGSAGYAGLVTGLLEQHLLKTNTGYSGAMVCGPEPMMKAAVPLLGEIPTWVSLESYMACGYGVCMGCVVKMTDGSYSRACCEGPVYHADQLVGYGAGHA